MAGVATKVGHIYLYFEVKAIARVIVKVGYMHLYSEVKAIARVARKLNMQDLKVLDL
jgi:hypothetical protein